MPVFALLFIPNADNLAYRDVEGGKIKMLIPADFKHQSKAEYKPKYQGDNPPDDYFFNTDMSEEVAITKMGGTATDVNSMRDMMTGVAKMLATKVYFNDTTRIKGVKMWMLEMEGNDGHAAKYIKYEFFNAGDVPYMAAAECQPQLKDKWKPVSDRIMSNIKW